MKRDRLERSPQLYLSEIISYIEIIESITKGLTYETFIKDVRNIYSVDDLIRNIGEAVRVLSKHKKVKQLFYSHRIPYIDLSDMRTDLTHEYFSMNTKSIWETATQTLPKLKPQFEKILNKLQSAP
jgi:uncharacterized protein with HEPN domain